MKVRVLGPIEVASSAGNRIPVTGTKLRGLIAILALEAGSTVATQRLVDALWGGQPVQGTNALQVLVSKLRRVLADAGDGDRIVTQPSGYQLQATRDEIDALRFEMLVTDGASNGRRAESVATDLSSALALWSGDALVDAPDTDVFDVIRTRLEELRRAAVEDLVEAELELGNHRRLASQLESLVAAEPLRERRWGQLMRALYRSGQQADALRAFQRARDTLIEEIGVEPSAELRRLEAAVLAHDETLLGNTTAPPPDAPIGEGFRRRGNIRHPVGSCIGREADLARLVTLVGGNRLVTLVGPGGVGKTRLAVELGVAMIAATSGGVWWVELSAARADGEALRAVQRALQLETPSNASRDAGLADIAEVLGDRSTIIVLDNCEHMLGEVVDLVEELLGRCAGMRVIATSREALRVRGELVFGVGPLDLTAAVALFEERIAGLGPSEDVDPGVIAQICERLDRLPLGLELAAGRARHMRLDEMLGRLADRFEVLHDDARVVRAHQEDLRAVADWSYDLLDPQERLVFERLGVFAGGATLRAAREVCSGADVATGEVELLLQRLVDKSLVYTDRSGSETRFRMLQTLGDYALHRLASSGDQPVRQAHARWVRDLAGSVQFGRRTTGAAIAAVHDEDVSVRDAVEWSLAADPHLALEICSMLAPFWFGTMRVSAGWALLSSALDAAGDDDPALRAAALGWAVVFSTMQYDVATADRLAEEASAFAAEAGDAMLSGRIACARALAAGYRADVAADPWVAEARANFERAGSPLGLGHASFAEGAARLLAGNLDVAVERLRHASEVFKEHEDHLGSILAVSRLGEAAWRCGDLDLFADTHADLLEIGRSSRSSGVVTGATARLAHARLAQGDLDTAQALASEALSSTSETFMPVISGYAFRSAGLVNIELGHPAQGRELLEQAIAAFERGTGKLGTGLAALCWVDVSRSFAGDDEVDAARRSALTAIDLARVSGDPWVLQQAEQNAGVTG